MFDPDAALGWVSGGSLDEGFESPTSFWDDGAYRESWRSEVQRIVDGADAGVLRTVALDPSTANFLRGYVLYRLGNEVRIQEKIFSTHQLEHPFELAAPSRSVPAYESETDDGWKISEWRVSLEELSAFLGHEHEHVHPRRREEHDGEEHTCFLSEARCVADVDPSTR